MAKHGISPRQLSQLYKKAHNLMRNIDGLQPQESFDELLKFLFFKQINEEKGPKIFYQFQLLSNGSFGKEQIKTVAQIKSNFKLYLKNTNSWSKKIWTDMSFHLSDKAIFSVFELFLDVNFSTIPFDIRSEAIKQFIPPGIRRGLGIFLTPDVVVKTMVDIVNPKQNSRVYDIAVGTGTFLIEVAKHWTSKTDNLTDISVWGSDKNPRMMLLADLNLGHLTNISFHKKLLDSLFDAQTTHDNTSNWPQPNFFDYIFTNPPFGVVLDSRNYDLKIYKTCRGKKNNQLKRQQSEVVFIEQSLKLLKPGGTLAIVLPKSIVTNSSLEAARTVLNGLGYVYAIVILPPETFQTAGTQTTTVLLFIKKFLENEDRNEKIQIRFSKISNVGFDSTGRKIDGNQLPGAAADILESLSKNESIGLCKMLPKVEKRNSIISLPSLIFGSNGLSSSLRLKDLVECVVIGKTPGRAKYTSNGLFLVKVGNLTGHGVNWIPRDRNFINGLDAKKRKITKTLMIKKGDILLTSSAHSPKYIAKKVDIVSSIPNHLNGEASFVGELMLIRPIPDKIDPFILLAYLRFSDTKERIQQMIRGQTAHLHPGDMLEMPIPEFIAKPHTPLKQISKILREEADINMKLNKNNYQRDKLMESLNADFQ
jgi:type I restriction enzyme M protein